MIYIILLTPALRRISTVTINSISSAPGAKIAKAVLVDIFKNSNKTYVFIGKDKSIDLRIYFAVYFSVAANASREYSQGVSIYIA